MNSLPQNNIQAFFLLCNGYQNNLSPRSLLIDHLKEGPSTDIKENLKGLKGVL